METSKSEILALEADRRSAMLRGDADRLSAILDDDAAYFPGAGGRQTAKAMLDAIRCGTVKYRDIQIEDEDVALFPDLAIVTGLLIMHVEISGEAVVNRRRFADVWMRRSGRWRLIVYFGVMVESDAREIQAEIEAGIRRALAAAKASGTDSHR